MAFLSRIFPETLWVFFSRLHRDFLGLSVIGGTIFLGLSLFSYDSIDPSFNTASPAHIQNMGGAFGASLADLLFQLLGISVWISVPIGFIWGIRLFLKPSFRLIPRLFTLFLCLLCLSSSLSGLFLSDLSFITLPYTHLFGGALGRILTQKTYEEFLNLHLMPSFLTLSGGFFLLSICFFYISLGITYRSWMATFRILKRGFFVALNILLKPLRIFPIFSKTGKTEFRLYPFLETAVDSEYVPQSLLKKKLSSKKNDMSFDSEESFNGKKQPIKTHETLSSQDSTSSYSSSSFLELKEDSTYELPPLGLLSSPSKKQETSYLTSEELEERARELESVLEEFGIRGDIQKVRPGPVVTLYELTPAPGIKSSRIIGLSDDIARSMSAISARVAVIPGQNAIGIELPNEIRETVYLQELLTSDAFERSATRLALALGKDIGGSSVIVDLSRMPHLLVAGTTGSGKSVAINTMILSLLYRLPPNLCKFIMIDPKMLELSVYEGIPHLLAPVVTEPKKAIVALKWTVREMEDRYRAMSKVGVRNIDGYNLRLANAKMTGEVLTRRVQTGFDNETGQPIFEDQPLDLEPLPYIVVVVDEMADLMLVAGKEIESTIQRLAQMARAAGIHLIMATQRPSVDVITGTIKANFPTRISFQVTSKIDSRTILGEQGAEQLLGQGDMLYMAAGGRITRLHGPFVKDEEVEKIVAFLRAQGSPSYLEDITQDTDEDPLNIEDEASSSKDALYNQALDLVLREGKASTSFIQRHLQIGYNRAARIIDHMEAEGVVTSANHVGKREVIGR